MLVAILRAVVVVSALYFFSVFHFFGAWSVLLVKLVGTFPWITVRSGFLSVKVVSVRVRAFRFWSEKVTPEAKSIQCFRAKESRKNFA